MVATLAAGELEPPRWAAGDSASGHTAIGNQPVKQRVDRHHRLNRTGVIGKARPRCVTADDCDHAECIGIDIGALAQGIGELTRALREFLSRLARIAASTAHGAVEIAARAAEGVIQ